MNTAIYSPVGHKLALNYLLEQLQQDGIISGQQLKHLSSHTTIKKGDAIHPLVVIADQGWESTTKPSYPLTLEPLTRWLAEQCGQPYLRIDPLKIDVNKVTSIVSQAYATKLKILPVAVTKRELTVATCEPYVNNWENELARIANLKIKRTIVNPNDIERYLFEFYGLSRSILGAVTDSSSQAISNLHNFEQLIEVGKVGEPDANDHHVVSLVDWLLQFAFEQRASDIHLEPRREKGRVRFRIDGVLHLVHEFPIILMGAITSRLKSLGRMDVTDRRRPPGWAGKNKNACR